MDDDDLLSEILLRLPARLLRLQALARPHLGPPLRPQFLGPPPPGPHRRRLPLRLRHRPLLQADPAPAGPRPARPLPRASRGRRRGGQPGVGVQGLPPRPRALRQPEPRRLRLPRGPGVGLWDPVTGEHRRLGSPQQVDRGWGECQVQGAVVCVAADDGHAHGGCHSSPFKVVLVATDRSAARACVYSSETGVWGDLITTGSGMAGVKSRFVLVGNRLYWLLLGLPVGILEFDLDKQSLSKIEMPPDSYVGCNSLYLTTVAEGGRLGFIALSRNVGAGFRAQLWERTADIDGLAGSGWMPGQAIELENLLPLTPRPRVESVLGIGGDENVAFLSTGRGVFVIHLESMQFQEIFDFDSYRFATMHPFRSFCAAGDL